MGIKAGGKIHQRNPEKCPIIIKSGKICIFRTFLKNQIHICLCMYVYVHVCAFMKNIQVANVQNMIPVEMCSLHRKYALCFLYVKDNETFVKQKVLSTDLGNKKVHKSTI